MAKFHVKLKIQGLDFEVDGERQDIPAITAAVSQQMANLLEPAAAVADGQKQLPSNGGGLDQSGGKNKGRSRRRSRSSSAGDGASGVAIDFRHDPAKYGNPDQSWSITDKCIWLLYVIREISGTNEVTGPQLAATFNAQFKSAGKLHPPNVTRELGKAKVNNPAAVGEDKGSWFLTDEGSRQAEQLIQSVLTGCGKIDLGGRFLPLRTDFGILREFYRDACVSLRA